MMGGLCPALRGGCAGFLHVSAMDAVHWVQKARRVPPECLYSPAIRTEAAAASGARRSPAAAACRPPWGGSTGDFVHSLMLYCMSYKRVK